MQGFNPVNWTLGTTPVLKTCPTIIWRKIGICRNYFNWKDYWYWRQNCFWSFCSSGRCFLDREKEKVQKASLHYQRNSYDQRRRESFFKKFVLFYPLRKYALYLEWIIYWWSTRAYFVLLFSVIQEYKPPCTRNCGSCIQLAIFSAMDSAGVHVLKSAFGIADRLEGVSIVTLKI